MRFGLALPHYDDSFPSSSDGRTATISGVLEYARRAEALGFDSVWVSDHLFLDLSKYGGPARRLSSPEALAMMTAIASATTRVRIGSLVLCAPFRNARVLAAQAAALDELSGGRIELGIGSGWYEPEFVEAGIPFGTAGARIAHLAEYARTLREHRKQPIWIGGKGGPKIASIVAESADGWNVVWKLTPDDYRARLGVLGAACERAGRDPASVRKSVGFYTLLGTSESDLAARYEKMRAFTPGVLDNVSLDAFADGTLVGTPDVVAGKIKEFEALGVEDVILTLGPSPFSVYDDEQVDLAARELLPLVR